MNCPSKIEINNLNKSFKVYLTHLFWHSKLFALLLIVCCETFKILQLSFAIIECKKLHIILEWHFSIINLLIYFFISSIWVGLSVHGVYQSVFNIWINFLRCKIRCQIMDDILSSTPDIPVEIFSWNWNWNSRWGPFPQVSTYFFMSFSAVQRICLFWQFTELWRTVGMVS